MQDAIEMSVIRRMLPYKKYLTHRCRGALQTGGPKRFDAQPGAAGHYWLHALRTSSCGRTSRVLGSAACLSWKTMLNWCATRPR